MNKNVKLLLIKSVILISFFSLELKFSYAEESNLSVLGVTLKLGAAKKDIFPNFSKYRVGCLDNSLPAPDCDSWMIQSSSAPFTPYASLDFEKGKLTQVWKYWEGGFEGTNPAKFVDTLHAVLSQYTGESGIASLNIKTKIQNDNGIKQKAIFIANSNSILVIEISEGAHTENGQLIPPFVNLYELLK